MTWNIAPESISLVILAIIWVYSRKGSHLPTLKNKIFQSCLTVTISAMLSNILSTVMIYHYTVVPLWMTWLVTSIYFILTPLMGLVYFLYVVSVVCAEGPRLRRLILCGSIPGLLYSLLVLVNFWSKSLFDVSLADGYVRGSLISVTYIVFYLYCLASIVVTICNHKRIGREIYRILAAFPILAVIVILVQQAYPDIILSGSAATCALLLIYLHLQNKQISLDYLTGVPNHQELLNMLGYLMKKSPEKPFTLIVVSLREFRHINAAQGQQGGDRLLKSVCQFLCKVGPRENIYRFGGDEFALLFPETNEQEIRGCMAAIRRRMEAPWEIGLYRCQLSVVLGIVSRSEVGETIENVISSIEYAVMQAKTGKCGWICYCDEAMREKLERRRNIIQILRDQLVSPTFEMYYQPICSVATGEFHYAESLMRIRDSAVGPIFPSEFIPIAEEAGLIADITYIILDKVCKFQHHLLEEGLCLNSIHVNFSAAQFSQPDLADRVLQIIHSNEIPPSAIKIEFTESTLAENPQVVTDFTLRLKREGIRMGLDDFGTGYSNIATVINTPFSTIKLDKSLVWASMESSVSALAVQNLVRTFKDLGQTVIAEGVETEEQKQLVTRFGVDQIQGFYYSKPLTGEDMEAFLRKNSGVPSRG